ncbi:hypothetical protein ACWD1Z_35380 [Streptomyces sp. NPDC002784]
MASLPQIAARFIGANQIGVRIMTRAPARRLTVPGPAVTTIGMLLLTRLTVDSSYWALIMPATVLLGIATSTAFLPAMTLAIQGIRPQDAGVASAMTSTSQQVSGSIGKALLNTITASVTASRAATHTAITHSAAVQGCVAAFWWAAAIMAPAALRVAVLPHST